MVKLAISLLIFRNNTTSLSFKGWWKFALFFDLFYSDFFAEESNKSLCSLLCYKIILSFVSEIGKQKKNVLSQNTFGQNYIVFNIQYNIIFYVFNYKQTNPIKRLINSPGRVILLDAKSLDCLNEVNISRTTWSYLPQHTI